MKRTIILVVLLAIVGILQGQNEESMRVSGSLTFMTQTNSLFTGGRFSDKPALNATVELGYKDFGFALSRNSDLVDPNSGANVLALTPYYSKTWDKYSMRMAMELDAFDYTKELNLMAPYVVLSKKGSLLDLNLMAAYAYTFRYADNVYVVRLSVAKTLPKEYTIKLYAWGMDWNGGSYSIAGELEKSFSPNIKMNVFYHLNNVKSANHQEFGTIRVSYSF